MWSRSLKRAFTKLSNGIDLLMHKVWQRKSTKRAQSPQNPTADISKISLLPRLPKNAVIVEVGGHVGNDTEEFALLFPEGTVHSFEPDPQNFLVHWKRTRWCTNVRQICAAVTDHAGVRLFHQSSGTYTASGSLLEPTAHLDLIPEITFPTEIPVPCLTLDDYCKELNISRIDLLWLDAQGAELLVLRGAKRMLSLTSFIYTEVSHLPLYAGGATYDVLKVELASLGFTVVEEFLPEEWPYGNVLFSRAGGV